MGDIEKSLNISHKGLLIHLKRLQEHGFIFKNRSKDNYKIKIIQIGQFGKDVLKCFKYSARTKEIFEDFNPIDKRLT